MQTILTQSSVLSPQSCAPSAAAAPAYITLAAAQNLFPGRPQKQLVCRWCTHGIKLGGQILRLEHRRAGRLIHTTEKWCQDFIVATTAAGQAKPRTLPGQRRHPRKRTEAQRNRDHADAMRELVGT